MKRILTFLRRERLYILLLILVVMLNLALFSYEKARLKPKEALKEAAVVQTEQPATEKAKEDIFLKKEEVEKVMAENSQLATIFGLTSLLAVALLLLGIVIDMLLLSKKFSNTGLDIRTYPIEGARWTIWDVVKVAILFLFFGYMLILIESLLVVVLPILKIDNFRMIVNTAILDTVVVLFIIHFAVDQYKETLVSIGLSVKNFAKNVFYGVVGYVATIPILVAVLGVIALIIHLTHYVPERQPVVELFLKEKDTAFLMFSTLFAAIVGPIFEEIFFRGFMYKAFKRMMGMYPAVIITSTVFAVLHTNIVGFLPIMVLGFVLTYLYEKTGTLVSSMTMHIIHNLSMVLLVFLVKQMRVF